MFVVKSIYIQIYSQVYGLRQYYNAVSPVTLEKTNWL